MSLNPNRVQALFHQVEDLPATEREPLLAAECGGDTDLRRRVEALLKAHDATWNLLDHSPAEVTSNGNGQATAVHRPAAGDVIGAYCLLRKLGEGGMGEVWEAEQGSPVRRRVALKLIKPGMDSAEVLRRFDIERQSLALMDHANIAKVFDAGMTPAGRPFFAMELVDGVPVTRYCDDHHLGVRDRLLLLATVCDAIQHAHQKGIIHRDIKPSNILVAQWDGRPVPKIIDFGVAKATRPSVCEPSHSTQYGTLIGTLEYMSPEQAGLNAADVDTRSDVYSLGVLMYELLTGGTPLDPSRFQTAGYDAALRLVREEEAPKPSTRLSRSPATLPAVATHRSLEPARLTRLVRGELDWIVMKCLEKDRERRYASANALALDIWRFLNDDAVQAFPPSNWYRFRKFVRRNRAGFVVASAVGIAAVLALAALATSTWLITQALNAETHAKGDLQRALGRERVDGYFHRIALAHRELSSDNLGRALKLLEECPEDLRGWEWHYLMRLCRVEPLVLYGPAEINSVAFSPDGDFIATADGDGAIRIWDSETGDVTRTLEGAHERFASCVAYHPDDVHVASVGADKQVKVWSLMSGLVVFARPCDALNADGKAYATAFSADGKLLAAGNAGTLEIWDWERDEKVQSFPGLEKRPISVAFSHDGRLASGGWRGSLNVWDVAGDRGLLREFPAAKASPHPVPAAAFSPDGSRLATASYNRRVDVWDAATGRSIHQLDHSGLVLGVAYSPGGRRIASVAEDRAVRIWDPDTGREVLALRGHTKQSGCVAFSPDGDRIASAGKDNTVRIWDATPLHGHEGQETLTFPRHDNEIWSLAVSPDGRQVVSAGFSAPAKVWDARTGNVTAEFPGHRDIVFSVAWQPGSPRRIVSAGAERGVFTVKVWDAETRREELTLPGVIAGDPEFFGATFSPDGSRIVTGQADGRVRVWDARTGVLLFTLDDRDPVVRAVVYSADGRYLAAASGDGVIRIWDATQLEEQAEARVELQARVPAQCLNVAFSPDGQRIATGGDENTVQIWDVETKTVLQTLRGHSGDVYTVAFSPVENGRWLASAGEDSTVKIWDSFAGGRPIRSFRGHTALVSSVVFTPDGRRLVSGSRDHKVKVWSVPASTTNHDAVAKMKSPFVD